MNTFSTAEIAKLLNVTPGWVRSQAHRALVSPTRDDRGHYRYSFQDVVALRTAITLHSPAVSARRIHKTLSRLEDQMHGERRLSSLQLTSDGKNILAREQSTLFNAETGQTLLDFEGGDLRNVTTLAATRRSDSVQSELSADEWFDVGLDYEHRHEPGEAEKAYRAACAIDPGHLHALINLGRLCHAAGDLDRALELYARAREAQADHPIVLFNLGVAMEDQGDSIEAMNLYRQALDIDAELAEAHYNLARLYVRCDEDAKAIRHFQAYNALSRNPD